MKNQMEQNFLEILGTPHKVILRFWKIETTRKMIVLF